MVSVWLASPRWARIRTHGRARQDPRDLRPAGEACGCALLPDHRRGKAYSGRSCDPRGGPNTRVITAHDAATGAELWRRRLIPGPGEPGNETWGAVPFEERGHVGSWMAPSYDPRAEPGLRRHVGHLAAAQVHARRD